MRQGPQKGETVFCRGERRGVFRRHFAGSVPVRPDGRAPSGDEAGEDADEEAMFNYDKPAFELDDYTEFKDFEEEAAEADENYILSLLEGDDK